MSPSASSNPLDLLIWRHQNDDRYSLWRVDEASPELLQRQPVTAGATLARDHQLVQVGRYLLEWGPLAMKDYAPVYPYRLIELDADRQDPLASPVLQKGLWPKQKFYGSRVDFGNPSGAAKNYDRDDRLTLVPHGSFVLNLIFTEGRGTYMLWNFDPAPQNPAQADPLPKPWTPQGAFVDIQLGHELTPIGNYMLDREPATGAWRLWSFDPQNPVPLVAPPLRSGVAEHLGPDHRLLVLGDRVLEWHVRDRSWRLWAFDATQADVLCGPLRSGTLPQDIDAGAAVTAFQPMRARPAASERTEPGTLGFMRQKIRHVVYYMIENRSFDHVCGWLYERNAKGLHKIGDRGPFAGASVSMSNSVPGPNPGDPPRVVHLSKYLDGRIDTSEPLDFLKSDPYHDNSDVLRQLWYGQPDGEARDLHPGMGGFLWNNGTDDVMLTYTPDQLPVLNGLAREFALADHWFSSMPGPTDPNRAFAFTGSTLGEANNFQNGLTYAEWPDRPHRPSIWKQLWAHGITDWKIYNSVEWMHFVHTYQLFLKGQIPSVDAAPQNHIAGMDQFKADAAAGKLPAFSFLEPVWIGGSGTTSYHPGADLVPGERALNEIYETLRNSPAWEETLLVITFDEHGGLFDHVPPPKGPNPWPNDVIDGFTFDRMGVRVPTLLVSPWIRRQTLLRTQPEDRQAFDSTSILATLLEWFGVPRSGWDLGLRTAAAPTFETVLDRSTPRKDHPTFTPPHDVDFPPDRDGPSRSIPLHDLHRLMLPRLIWSMVGHKLDASEVARISLEIQTQATDLQTLARLLNDLEKRHA
jgi:phospholipase C